MTYGRSYHHLERGVPKFWQFGSSQGYGANVFRFIDQDLMAVAIGNNNQYLGRYIAGALNPIMESIYTKPASIDPSLLDIVPIDPTELKQWTGDYLNDDLGFVRSFEVINDTLKMMRGPNGLSLLPLGNNTFQALMQSDDEVIFQFGEEANQRFFEVSSGGSAFNRYHFIPEDITTDLDQYTGTYIHKGLDLIYSIERSEDQLVLKNATLGDVPMRYVGHNRFTTNVYALSSVIFHTNAPEKLEIKAPGVKGIFFNKVQMDSQS